MANTYRTITIGKYTSPDRWGYYITFTRVRDGDNPVYKEREYQITGFRYYKIRDTLGNPTRVDDLTYEYQEHYDRCIHKWEWQGYRYASDVAGPVTTIIEQQWCIYCHKRRVHTYKKVNEV